MKPAPHGFASRFVCILAVAAISLLLGDTTAFAASSSDGKTPVEYRITVLTDRPEALYKKGETVTFNIELEHNQAPAAEGEVEWVLTKDGIPLAEPQQGKVTLQGGKATVTGKLDEPGFLQCKVTYKPSGPAVSALAAAGVDLFEIKPSLPVPDDFDAFWAEKKKLLAAVPINAKITPVPAPPNRKGVETFDVACDSVGAPSTAYYARPIGAKPKSLPALLFVPGAGVRTANLDGVAGWAGNGLLVMEINAHGILNGQPSAYYTGLDAGELKDYRTRGRESRDTYYFLGVYYRMLRAFDFLTSQPEWDGKTLILIGGSQGGGLALAGAALEQRVTYALITVPGLTDHSGTLAGRIAGWPKAVPKGADGAPDPKVIEALRYYDGVNFATRIKIPVHCEIGFIDVICPATCSYAAYNNLAGVKEVKNFPNAGHDIGPQIWNDMKLLTLAHVASQAGKAAPSAP